MSDSPAALSLHLLRISPKTQWAFVQLRSHAGLIGVGEATLNGQQAALLQAARRIAPLAGQASLAQPAAFAAALSPSGLPDAAITSAIDHALWDLHAQQGQQRLAAVLAASMADSLADTQGGARRQALPVYANINRRTLDRSPAGFAASARDAAQAGFQAFKIAPFDEVDRATCALGQGTQAMQAGLQRVQAVRNAVGPGARLMVDCHWRFDEPAAAAMIDALAPFGLYWVECPLPEQPDHIPALVRLRRQAHRHGMRLAGLEECIGLGAFAPFVAAGAYDVVMPDVKYFGGLQPLLRAAAWFAAQGVAVAPHNPSGPICHAVSLHLSAAMAGFDCLELQYDESPLFETLVSPALPPRQQGHSALPAGPGVGVALSASGMASAHALAALDWAF